MAFAPPTFNLHVDIYTGPWSGKVLRASVMGNLSWGRRVQGNGPEGNGGVPGSASFFNLLLLPAGTDVRDYFLQGVYDVLEAPSGTGRWFNVWAVADVAKGFPNEYRAAAVLPIGQRVDALEYPGLFWPVPMP